MTLAGLIKKNRIALFIFNAESYKRICKSQELSIAMNPETEDYEFICKENPETVLKYYNPSIAQNLVMFKGDPAFEYLYRLFYYRATDDYAKTDVMIVFMFDGDANSGYRAWQIPASSIVFDEMACTDSTLNFTIDFGGVINTGTATVIDGVPSFTPDPASLTVDTTSVTLTAGASSTLSLTGAVAPVSVQTVGITDVSATVNGSTITIVASEFAPAGTGTIEISDGAIPPKTASVSVEVQAVTPPVIVATPSSVSLGASDSATVTLSGGTTPYIFNGTVDHVTVSISDDTVTITTDEYAESTSTSIYIEDSAVPANTVQIDLYVTV